MMTNQHTATPTGYELVHRSCIVRLGPQMALYTESNHASVGVLSVASVDGYLEVVTDFDGDTELCLSATANPDATLVLKGVSAGASGGASVTRFCLSSSKTLPYGSSSVRPAYTKIPPTSAVFDSDADNLWINFLSLRTVA